MKTSLKITLITLLVLIVLAGAVALSISPVAKYCVEKYSKEMVGRQVNLDKLRFNIFNGELRVDNIRMLEADDTTVFASIGEVYVDMRLWPLVKNRVAIQEVIVTTPKVSIYQTGSQFNFDDLLMRFLPNSTQVETPDHSTPWEVGIDYIHLAGGHVFYEDVEIGATWGFDDLNATIPGIYFKDKTDMDVLLNFSQGGSLGLKLAYNMDNTDYDLHIDLQRLALNGRLPYVQQTLNVRDLQGIFSANLHMNGNMNQLMDIYFDGTMDLSQFSMEDMQGRKVLRTDSLHVGLTRGSLRHNQFYFNRLYLLGLETAFELYKDGSNNIALLLKPTTSTAKEAPVAETEVSEPLDVRIEDLEIARSTVRFRDETHIRPFEYHLSNIRMKTSFDMNKPNKVVIDAQVQKTGSARIRWEGSATGLDNHNLLLTLTNIDLRDFSPYCEHYTAYPLVNGNLSFRSHNIIRNRQLTGTNHLDMFEPQADKKFKELTPEFNLPLRLGLYVLKDRKGHVKIDLPVKGSIDNPDFSYRKIIFHALGNVLVKVVTSPFSFLSGGDNLEYIAIAPLQREFSAEQYTKLDKLADMLRDKPEMKVVLTQRIDYAEALHMQEQNNLKMAYYNHLRAADTTATHTPLTMVDYEHIQDMNFKSDAVMQFADSLIRLTGGDPAKLAATQKAETLYRTKATEQLSVMLERRNAAIRTYMADMQGLPATSLRVESLTTEELQAYAGKNRYTVGIEIEGETAEASTHPNDVNALRESMGLAPEEQPEAPAEGPINE